MEAVTDVLELAGGPVRLRETHAAVEELFRERVPFSSVNEALSTPRAELTRGSDGCATALGSQRLPHTGLARRDEARLRTRRSPLRVGGGSANARELAASLA